MLLNSSITEIFNEYIGRPVIIFLWYLIPIVSKYFS